MSEHILTSRVDVDGDQVGICGKAFAEPATSLSNGSRLCVDCLVVLATEMGRIQEIKARGI